MSNTKLTDLALIQFTGEKTEAFLQGQFTCDVSSLHTASYSLAAHCNRQGRVMSLGYLFQYETSFYYCLPSNIAEQAIKELAKYAQFSKVVLEIVNAPIFGLIDEKLPSIEKTLTISSQRLLLLDFNQEFNVENTCDETQWHLLDIQQGIPRIYPETIGLFLPHHINLVELSAVSFTKGCYIGQEIIARMQHKAKIKQGMQTYLSAEPISPGDKIQGKTCVDSLEINGQYHCLVIAPITL